MIMHRPKFALIELVKSVCPKVKGFRDSVFSSPRFYGFRPVGSRKVAKVSLKVGLQRSVRRVGDWYHWSTPEVGRNTTGDAYVGHPVARRLGTFGGTRGFPSACLGWVLSSAWNLSVAVFARHGSKRAERLPTETRTPVTGASRRYRPGRRCAVAPREAEPRSACGKTV